MDPKAFVAGMSALGAGMAMIGRPWPWYRRGLCCRSGVLRNRPSAGGAGRYHPYHDPWYLQAESTGIYALVIALILLFANPSLASFNWKSQYPNCLRRFAEKLRGNFVAAPCNTQSIARHLRLVRTQFYLANRSCQLKYCLFIDRAY